MATEYRCDCCREVYKVKNDIVTCTDCTPIQRAFERHVDGKMADVLAKSTVEDKQKFFAKHGKKIPAPDASPPGAAKASATSHAKAASGAGSKING